MKELIDALFKESLIQRCLLKDAEIIKQTSTYRQLLNRAEDTNLRIQFLANYDALLRLIEILLLDFGYMLGDHPHSTARRIIEYLAPQFEISRIISLRHLVKKSDYQPPLDELHYLISIRLTIQELSFPLTQN